jgi:tetratricopeptide (TPR) repeat protein
MAMACFHLEEYEKAISLFSKIDLENDEYFVLSWFNKGICYMKLKFQEAIQFFNNISGRISSNLVDSNNPNQVTFGRREICDCYLLLLQLFSET